MVDSIIKMLKHLGDKFTSAMRDSYSKLHIGRIIHFHTNMSRELETSHDEHVVLQNNSQHIMRLSGNDTNTSSRSPFPPLQNNSRQENFQILASTLSICFNKSGSSSLKMSWHFPRNTGLLMTSSTYPHLSLENTFGGHRH